MNELILPGGPGMIWKDVIITDAHGRSVSRHRTANESLDVSGLAPGFYALTATGDRGRITWNFLKE
jgi:hypothetical protein